VLAHCIHDHGSLFRLHAAVVMPDHVHLVLTPLVDETGAPIPLSKIMNRIKGASAHSVNRVLRRTGHVWQDESFDHVLRSYESARAKAEYVCENPVRAQLVEHEDDYRWLWREWVEGVTDCAHFGP
jgi:REP element-mobilizing transposase RayT